MPLSWTTYFKPNGDDGGCRDNETLGWCCGLAGSSEYSNSLSRVTTCRLTQTVAAIRCLPVG